MRCRQRQPENGQPYQPSVTAVGMGPGSAGTALHQLHSPGEQEVECSKILRRSESSQPRSTPAHLLLALLLLRVRRLRRAGEVSLSGASLIVLSVREIAPSHLSVVALLVALSAIAVAALHPGNATAALWPSCCVARPGSNCTEGTGHDRHSLCPLGSAAALHTFCALRSQYAPFSATRIPAAAEARCGQPQGPRPRRGGERRTSRARRP
jgi:hypothetical protein